MAYVNFSKKQGAKDLWEFGEDAYIEKALNLTDDEMLHIQAKVDDFVTPEMLRSIGRSPNGTDLGTMTAYALVAYFEGNPRPLARKRRRNKALLPDYLKSSMDENLDEQMKYLTMRFPPDVTTKEKGPDAS